MENLKLTQDFRSLQSEKTVSGLLAVQFNSYQIECFFEAMGLYRTGVANTSIAIDRSIAESQLVDRA